MKSKCSDVVHLKSKSLKEEEYDLKDRINTFYSRKRDLLNIIVEEKNNDPSKKIHEIEKEAKESDPFRGFIADNEEPMNKGTENKPCQYHSRGFLYTWLVMQVLSFMFRLQTAHGKREMYIK